MLLSIITTDRQPGMAKMLERELKDIEHEILYNTWETGLKKAKGNFVCLLEPNSAVKKGSIRQNLAVFMDNPSYRKLAMVSPAVDYPVINSPLSTFTYNFKGFALKLANAKHGIQSARIGCVPGAIIRKSSILKSNIDYKGNILAFSNALSINFWERGLRISCNPETVYYMPELTSYKQGKKVFPSEELVNMWEHEMIL